MAQQASWKAELLAKIGFTLLALIVCSGLSSAVSLFAIIPCGRIINISGHQKGYIIHELENFERCAWIIKSDMKNVKVKYASEDLGGHSGTVIGELDAGDERLSCSKLSSDGELTARTPFVLYYTKFVFLLPTLWKRNFVIELTPVDDGNKRESQPATYHINTMKKGSLAAAPTRLESMLDMMSVFQTQKPNGTGRDFVCSPTVTHQCCDYIGVYTMGLFSDGGRCTKTSKLNEGYGKGSTDDTVVILHWSHKTANESQCRLTWSESAHTTSKYSFSSSSRSYF